MAEARASALADATLITCSLGSCIGISVYDPVAGAGGLLHFQLPESGIDPSRAVYAPATFADTGIALLLSEVESLGGVRERLTVKAAGAARIVGYGGACGIALRNQAALRRVLRRHALVLDASDLGGYGPRTLLLRLADGATLLKSGGRTTVL